MKKKYHETLARAVSYALLILPGFCSLNVKATPLKTFEHHSYIVPADTAITRKNITLATATPAVVKIPIDTTRWYQLNNVSNGLGGLTDGILNQNVNTGYGKLISNWDAFYPVLPGESITLTQIKFYSFQGNLGNSPMTLAVIDSNNVRTNIATFYGGVYLTWIGPYPGVAGFNLNTPISHIKYIVVNSWGGYPTEMQLYGYYTAPPPATPVVQKAYPLNQYLGVNGFEWDFELGNNPGVVNKPLLKAMESFTQLRHYLDWNKLESEQGEYTFNPVHSGSWNYDAMYKACKANNIFVLGDIKTQPSWMVATYPANMQDSENIPVLYGADVNDPNSYLLQAKVVFQYAARYGSNGSVPLNLLSVDPTTRWTDDPQNKVKEDMSLIHYVECDNERDKWWKGLLAYQTSYQYAANMSAFYDGNKNTMGAAAGVKNADPNMQVVMGGLSSPDPSYVHGMIEWCKQNRGYNADGTVNIDFDVINYHYYSNNGTISAPATTGLAPELSGAFQIAQSFVAMSHQYANDRPVWVTEAGYDVNPGSPQRAPAIGSKTPLLVQADWVLRTSLLYARAGIARTFFYESYDDDPTNPIQYASSGLLNEDQSRKPAADYLFQTNKLFGSYVFQSSQTASSIIVDTYALDTSKMYMLVSPTASGKTVAYTLSLPTADSAYIYTPTAGANNMALNAVPVVSGKVALKVTETPIFVLPRGAPTDTLPYIKPPTGYFVNPPTNNTATGNITVYPNPSAHYVTVAISNTNMADVTIKITDVNSGTVYKTYTFSKNSNDFANTIDISSVPMGVCIIQVIQGNQVTMKKVLKTYE